jgi:uncharacterized protein YjbI with pentapeptide repeats
MANPEQLEILKQGVDAWNKWRREHRDVFPDLSGVYLNGADLFESNLNNSDLSQSSLGYVDLGHANLRHADLIHAHIGHVDFSYSDLSYADFRLATLVNVSLSTADLINAKLGYTELVNIDLSHARLSGADFTGARLSQAIFADNDLSEVKGLEMVMHGGPSSIGVDTLYKSAGKIPEAFLRGCGVPDDFIAFIPSHFGVQQAIQFYSCFISYSTRDEEFARRLYSRMRDEKLRVWFAPEDVKGGEKLFEQIERAIQVHDRLLIVLSERSLESKWVMTEIRKARKVELRENRRKLFPIRLVDYETLQAWECFDADTGEDLASEVRQYFIPDFSNWKDHDAFEKAFDRLLRDLRDEENRKPS